MVEVDEKQMIGEVKERNRFYTTIVEIRETAVSAYSNDKGIPPLYNEKIILIVDKCNKALQDVI